MDDHKRENGLAISYVTPVIFAFVRVGPQGNEAAV